MTTIAQALQAASDSLTEDNWHKGSYFATKDNGICMCVHGAIQAQVNLAVQSALSVFSKSLLVSAMSPSKAAAVAAAWLVSPAVLASVAQAAACAEATAAEGEEAREDAAPGGDYHQMWEEIPNWVKAHRTEAHYIAGMVGLTATFNDLGITTLSDIKTKLAEAVKVAEKLGV